MKRIRRMLLVLLTGIMAVAGTGCGSSVKAAESSDKTGEALKVLRLGCTGASGVPSMEIGNLACNKGYLEEELNKAGFTVELSDFGGGPYVNEALASKAIDVAVYGDFPALTCKSNGIDTTMIAVMNAKQQYGILAADDSIKTPKDLEGKRVIVSQGTSIQFVWEMYAKARGIRTDQVEVINTMDAAALLQTGDADAYVSVLYAQKRYEEMGIGHIIDDTADIPDAAPQLVAVADSEFLKENPDAGVAVVKALIRAWRDAVEDPDAFYDAIATEEMSAQLMKSGYEFDESLSFLSPEITEESLRKLEALNTFLVNNAYIAVPVEIDAFIDTSYYERAEKELEK